MAVAAKRWAWALCGGVVAAHMSACAAADDKDTDSTPVSGSGGEASSAASGGNTGAGAAIGSGGSASLGSGGSSVGSDTSGRALGSADGDGSGCADGVTLDACGICDGDGSACSCSSGFCADVVFEHNEVRRQVNLGSYFAQPQAQPAIAMMTWDPLIAAKAQEYADSVSDFAEGHSSDSFRTYQSTYYDGYHGENMAIGGGEYAQPSYFVATSWAASEAQNCVAEGCGGHYTQIVWRSSIAVGCGQKSGVTFSSNGTTYTGTLTVCQYGPGGNTNSGAPY